MISEKCFEFSEFENYQSDTEVLLSDDLSTRIWVASFVKSPIIFNVMEGKYASFFTD